MTERTVKTVTEVADELSEPPSRVNYIIQKQRLKPASNRDYSAIRCAASRGNQTGVIRYPDTERELMSAEVQTLEPLLVDISAAALLGMRKSAFYSLLRSGRIGPQAVFLTSRPMFDVAELRRWISSKDSLMGTLPNREKWLAMKGEGQ